MPPRTLPELLAWRAAESPDGIAYTFGETVSWRGFLERVKTLAAALRALGLEPGDRVAVMGPTTPEWTLVDQACLWAGGISVGIYSSHTAEQVAFLLRDCGARLAFAGSAEELAVLREAMRDAPECRTVIGWGSAGAPLTVDGLLAQARERGDAQAAATPRCADDTAILIYTSGTTGRPKGAMLSHGGCVHQVDVLAELIPLDGVTDSTVSFLPMAHATERIISFYGRIRTGIRTRFVGSMDAARIRQALTEARPTLFGSVPRLYEKVYAQIRERLSGARPRQRRIFAWAEGIGRQWSRLQREGGAPALALRVQHALADRLVLRRIRDGFGGRIAHCLTGAAAIDPGILEFFHAAGLLICEGYGMTECGGMATVNPEHRPRFGTVGLALPGFEVRLAGDGEICLRSRSVFQGYWNLPAETETALQDGWLHTGDLGELDADGYLRLTDRKKNLLVTSGGKNVAPAAIEALLGAEPLLGPALVLGDRRPYVTALLTLDLEAARRCAGATAAPLAELAAHPEVQARVRAAVAAGNQRLARYERIRRYRILTQELTVQGGELTPTLKLRRRVVAERCAAEIESLYQEPPGSSVVDVEPRGG